MCGLTGGWSRKRFELLREALPAMGGAINHRGPDDGGQWLDADAGIAIAHRRLAIIDLSTAGHQPMHSSSKRWVIAYNGEIYNHLELRDELERSNSAPLWKGHSDTETLLAAIENWGVDEALRRSHGMFAFALWDQQEKCLWLARDRFGEKPLYYGWNRGVFLFGSELKALRRLTGFDASVDRDALALYLRYSSIPAPYSIYSGIKKLLPGHFLKLDSHQLETGECPMPQPYWLATDAIAEGHKQPFVGSEIEAVDALDSLLQHSVKRQMAADVPLGAFLSGGVDSSAIVALMQAQSTKSVQTFSIGFDEPEYNEANYAAAVAQHLGTVHTELYVTAEDAISIIPELPDVYDEPFADSSQIPTILVSRLAAANLTVALSGDGGDELFGGYSRYFLAARLWSRVSLIPKPLRQALGRVVSSIPAGDIGRLYGLVEPFIPRDRRWNSPEDKIRKGGDLLSAANGEELYRNLCSYGSPDDLISGMETPSSFGPPRDVRLADLTEYMMLEDTCRYLPDDILVKVDRAAMASSLETRVPFLDHRLFEFAWKLPMHLKVRDGVGKYVLRQVLNRYVPEALINRPKMGFAIPLGAWLRGPLREWASILLDPNRLRQEGYFNPDIIERMWREHQSGERDWKSQLWIVLMFQAWLERK
jgi:asparagine synthase (glutamine-hydrolysing)